jgi:hypothetical protein
MTDVRQAIPMGDEELNTLTVELACGMLEHTAGQIAGEPDRPRLINGERGVRRVREHTFQGRRGMH